MRKKNVLMIYPEVRDSFWSYKSILPYIKKKSMMPPLGLMTIAALLPDRYEITLVDMNITPFRPSLLDGVDLILASVTSAQQDSFMELMPILQGSNIPTVIGGPFATSLYREEDLDILFDVIGGFDHYVIGEAEEVFPRFLADFEAGHAEQFYVGGHVEMRISPTPRYDLIDSRQYAGMGLQFSRGCPYDCEFCEITYQFGKKVRTKEPVQVIREMQAIYNTGFRGALFIVDDNFIMRKPVVKELLRLIAAWQAERGNPFAITVMASVNLSEDDELLGMMVDAGLSCVFLGIESPNQDSLIEMEKHQNTGVDILAAVEKIQSYGIEVTAGFIVGFDSDPADIFERQIEFIQQSGIVKAMVGLLQLSPNSRLYQRLLAEGRIITDVIPSNNTHVEVLNYVPKIPADQLIEGYHRILRELYNPKKYFDRCILLLKRLRRGKRPTARLSRVNILPYIIPFFRLVSLQLFSRYSLQYLKFMFKTLWLDYRYIPKAFVIAVMGHHFFTTIGDIIERQDEIPSAE